MATALWSKATLAFTLFSVVLVALTAAQDSLLTNEEQLPPIPENILVGAYYYPWHGDDFHRGGGYLRKELVPRQYPTLGEYDDTRPEILAQHLAWSRQANINLWVRSAHVLWKLSLSFFFSTMLRICHCWILP